MRYHTGLFIPGPTNIPEAVRRALNVSMEDMRSSEFPKLTLPLFDPNAAEFSEGAHARLADAIAGWKKATQENPFKHERI